MMAGVDTCNERAIGEEDSADDMVTVSQRKHLLACASARSGVPTYIHAERLAAAAALWTMEHQKA